MVCGCETPLLAGNEGQICIVIDYQWILHNYYERTVITLLPICLCYMAKRSPNGCHLALVKRPKWSKNCSKSITQPVLKLQVLLFYRLTLLAIFLDQKRAQQPEYHRLRTGTSIAVAFASANMPQSYKLGCDITFTMSQLILSSNGLMMEQICFLVIEPIRPV